MKKQMYIYVVRQTQPACDYQDTAIAAFTNERTATRLARKLNQEYGENCVFDDDWDFVEYDMQGDPHYYDVETIKLNPRLQDYL